MRLFTVLLGILLFALPTRAADPPNLDVLLRSGGFPYRNLGPFRCGSWVSDIAVPETPAKAHLYTFYVAPRNGGLWKTTNNGTTFQQVFENQNVSSMGCVSVAPSNADFVWTGTGDASATRSAYWGDGVYKSTNAGRTWQNMGLKDTQHVARIVIHPTNPDNVYVAALGHLFTTNEERGIFQTTDGGQTWKKILYVDDKTGGVDLVMDRSDPNTLYAATYQHRRDGWVLHDGGPGSAVYKTTNGGAKWDKLTNGLPSGTIGRIGLDICRSNPKILYAVLENHDAGGGAVYRTDDAGATWRKVSPAGVNISSKSGYAFNQIRVDPNNPDRIMITGASLYYSQDGGKTFGGSRPFARAFGDFRVFWFDHENSDRMIAGSDGGVCLSYDGGRTCDHLYNMPLGEVYALTVDMETPYNVYVGLQDHESWKGPSRGISGNVEGIGAWSTVGVGDGMYNQVDPTDSRWVYNTQEFGQPARFDQLTRTRTMITPARQNQGGRRFNWVTPLRLSPHDPKIVYVGADVLFRSKNRGDTWEIISPDLTTNDPSKIRQGPSIQFCTITTISESPAAAGVIWVGCDDGKVQVTRDAGKSWTDVTESIAKAGGPVNAWVTRVFGSHHQPGTAYVAKSQHRRDDFRPFLYKTTDFGATWTQIVEGLPIRPINVVFEDSKNPNFLAVGNDMGVYVTLSGGKQWAALKSNMPVVPTHDLLIHPRDGDLVAGTYGRGVWITNVDPLRELTEEVMNKDVHFFSVTPQAKRAEGVLGNYRLLGDRHLTTPNGPGGLSFDYYLKERPQGRVTITLANAAGTMVRTLDGTTQVGINRVALNLNEFGGGRGGGRGGGQAQAPPAAGEYIATLTVGDTKMTQKVRILPLAQQPQVAQQPRIYWGDDVPKGWNGDWPQELKTVPERTGYLRTMTTQQLHEWIAALKTTSENVHSIEMFTSPLKKVAPAMVLANPRVTSPKQARASGKPVVFLLGNIHPPEPEAAEALLMVARELAAGKRNAILDKVIVMIAPIFNVDGTDNVVRQDGSLGSQTPVMLGVRENSQRLDLNRDGVKLETVEARGLYRTLNEWDPLLMLDGHLMSRVFHGYANTYGTTTVPAAAPGPRLYMEETLFPAVRDKVRTEFGLEVFTHALATPNTWPPQAWSHDRAAWTVEAKFLVNDFGLRNRFAIITETPGQPTFERRVYAHYAYITALLEYVGTHADQMRAVAKKADDDTVKAVLSGAEAGTLTNFLDGEYRSRGKIELLAYRTSDTKGPPEVVPNVDDLTKAVGTRSARVPRAYLLPAKLEGIAEKLRLHNVQVTTLKANVQVEGEEFTIERMSSVRRSGYAMTTLDGTFSPVVTRDFPADSFYVDMAQPMANAAFYYLEPQSRDGFVGWHVLDEVLRELGADKRPVVYPIFKVRRIVKKD